MEALLPAFWPEMRTWVEPERPGPLVGSHLLHTSIGRWWVDRWPDPRASVMLAGGNLAVRGDVGVLGCDTLRAFVQALLVDWDRILVDVAPGAEEELARALGAPQTWQCVFHSRPRAAVAARPARAGLRRIEANDANALLALDPDLHWISDTYDGPIGLARTATAWGWWVDGRLVAVAAPFFVGSTYEDIGVVTEPEHRGRGGSAACAAALAADVERRGRVPSWTTSPDNEASLRVADKLGFRQCGEGVLLVAGKPM